MKPVADLWFSIGAYPHDILLVRESHIDPYAVGDIWVNADFAAHEGASGQVITWEEHSQLC